MEPFIPLRIGNPFKIRKIIFEFILIAPLIFGSRLSLITPQPASSFSPDEDSTHPPYKSLNHHASIITGKRIEYPLTVEETFFLSEKGERAASIVSKSYERTDNPESEMVHRPVIFAFNGGPSFSSVWLHMGLLGPKRVMLQDGGAEEGKILTPCWMWLRLCFSTLRGMGFSRMLGEGNEHFFSGVQQDARVTCEFIEGWIERNESWNSLKFLMGESYGTVRAAVVARMLAGGTFETGRMDALTINGVILLGKAMNLSGARFGDTNFINVLPKIVDSAWYHGKLEAKTSSLEEHVEKGCYFAADEYLRALYKGSALTPEGKNNIVRRLSELTGLSPEFILEKNLRLDAHSFSKELIREEGKQLGLYDGRFTLPFSPSDQDHVSDVPAMGQYAPAFGAALNEYLKKKIKVAINLTYNALNFKEVNARWGNRFVPGVHVPSKNYAEDISIALRRNSSLRLFIGTGYFDLLTTIGSAEYTLKHIEIDLDRVYFKCYRSGHMPYIGASSWRLLAEDLREFITSLSLSQKEKSQIKRERGFSGNLSKE